MTRCYDSMHCHRREHRCRSAAAELVGLLVNLGGPPDENWLRTRKEIHLRRTAALAAAAAGWNMPGEPPVARIGGSIAGPETGRVLAVAQNNVYTGRAPESYLLVTLILSKLLRLRLLLLLLLPLLFRASGEVHLRVHLLHLSEVGVHEI